MQIRSIHVQNFRSVFNETLLCQNLTVLVGPNGSGKSSFLQAINKFYDPSAKYTEEDFFNKDTLVDIITTIAFHDLTEDEKELFQKYIEDEELTVQKVVSWKDGKTIQKYHGTSLVNLEFDGFRNASGQNMRIKYEELRENTYTELPRYRNKEEAEKILQNWESSHPDQCSRYRDDGQFFGFKEVGKANLARFTKFILVEAVRDASEAVIEKKGTPLNEIMDFVVRSILLQRNDVVELQENINKQYAQVMDPSRITELLSLEKDLSTTLTTYVPDTEVKLSWIKEEIFDIPLPKADVKLVEDGFPSSVERTGHGLQRAFILTMLQHLARIQTSVNEEPNEIEEEKSEIPDGRTSIKLPHLILAIEEPELYQHPNRQRHLAKIFLELVENSNNIRDDHMQIIYSTHSPLFVDINYSEKIRVFHKVKEKSDKPKQTKVISTNLDKVAKRLEEINEQPEGTYTGDSLKPRLQCLMTPWMNEGFFADVAVLVEGEEDRAAVLGTANALERDFESLGISVIPCMGKTNIDKPTIIFSEFQIPVYAIWDSDSETKDANPETNHRLLRLFHCPIDDWPEIVTDQFACFKHTLKKTMQTEIGTELYNKLLDECCNRLCYTERKHASKNPQIIREIISEARKMGKTSETLENIIHQIVSLKD